MRVLLTGAAGFSGRHLTDALLADDHDVVALTGRGGPTRPRSVTPPPRLTLMAGDLADDLDLPEGIDAVVHTAATSPGPCVNASSADFVRDNAEGTRRLVRWARRTGVRTIVYFSSVSVFGRIAGPVLHESCPRVDPDTYGVCKWLGERMLEDEASTVASLALELPAVIGPGARRNWLATMAAAAAAGQEIVYFHGDADYNNGVHVDDLAFFVAALLRRELRGHDRVLLAAAPPMKVRDMVAAIASGLGGRSRLREVPPARPAFTISTAHAQERYGFRPVAMAEVVARFVAEVRPGPRA